MAKKPYLDSDASIPGPQNTTGYQLGWNKGRWIVIKGNAGSQCQSQAESQALADQLNSIVSFASKQGKKI